MTNNNNKKNVNKNSNKTNNNKSKKNNSKGKKKLNVAYTNAQKMAIHGMVNPFDDSGYLRFPDNHGLTIIPGCSRTTGTITTGAAGLGVLYIVPQFSNKSFDSYTPAGTTVTVSSDFTKSVFAATFSGKCRVINAAVRWWDISPATSGSGILTGVEWTSPVSTSITAANIAATEHVAMDPREGGAYIFKSIDNHREFQDQSTTDSRSLDAIMNPFLLWYEGAVSTTVLAYEIVFNFETVVENDLAKQIGPTPNQHHVIQRPYHNHVTGFFHGNFSNVMKQLKEHAEQRMVQVSKAAMDSGLKYLLTEAEDAIPLLLGV